MKQRSSPLRIGTRKKFGPFSALQTDWEWSNRFGWSVPLFESSGVVYGVDASLFLLFPLLILTLRMRLLPFYYFEIPALAYWAMALLVACGYALSLFAHEAAHLFVARRFKQRPIGFVLHLFGSGTPQEMRGSTLWQVIAESFSGVLTSFLLAGASVGAMLLSERYRLPDSVTHILFHLAAANLSLALFHLLPVFPLDAGQLLLAVLSRKRGMPLRALQILSVLGSVVLLGVLLVGVSQLTAERPILGGWIVLLAILLAKAFFTDYEYWKLALRLEGIPIERMVNRNPIRVSANSTLAEFSDGYATRYDFPSYPVMDGEELIGRIDQKSLRRVSAAHWNFLRVRDVCTLATRANTIAPSSKAEDALSQMIHTGNSRLLVSDGAGDVGVLSYGDLLRAS